MKKIDELICPQCGHELTLNQTLLKDMAQKLELDFKKKWDQEKFQLKLEIEEKEKIIVEVERQEIELRKKNRLLEEREKKIELEIERKIDDEKNKIQQQLTQTLCNEFQLKSAEKDKQLQEMRVQIEELKRKSELGSQQTQGEVLEIYLEGILKKNFPLDQIQPVPKGISGGDIIQNVFNQLGQKVGTILWETKRTKNWSENWILKLKEDQRLVSSDLAVIVSHSLPKDIKRLTLIDGIWVVDELTASGLAIVLRNQLILLHQTKSFIENKDHKMEFLYQYLTGPQFKQRVESILESFTIMQDELLKEKRLMEKTWAIREKQIGKVFSSTSMMVGEVQGILGPQNLPKINYLEMDE
jgi:hypothetical protein